MQIIEVEPEKPKLNMQNSLFGTDRQGKLGGVSFSVSPYRKRCANLSRTVSVRLMFRKCMGIK